MKCKVDSLGDQALVVLGGEVGIQNIATLKEALLTSISRSAGVVVDVDGVTRADLSFLQLLCAAHRSAMAIGKPLCLGGASTGCIHRVTADAGYTRKHGCDLDSTGTCLWATGDEP